MKGHEVIALLREILQGDELIVSSNGNISRQAFHYLPKQVYLRGSMGLPVAVGLGLAVAQPDRKVLVLVGDGNFLMGLGSMATVAYVKPLNLKILIIDNQLYATTGGQKTTSSVINYENLMRGFGITAVESIGPDGDGLPIREKLNWFLKKAGLRVLHVKVQPGDHPLENIPWHPRKIKSEFLTRFFKN